MPIALPPRHPNYRFPRMSSQTFQAQFSLIHDNCHSYEHLKLVRTHCYNVLSDADKWQSEFLKEHYILDTLVVKSEIFIPAIHDRNFNRTPLEFTLDMHSYKDGSCSNKIFKLRHYIAYVESIILPRINNYIHRYGCRIEMTFADMSQSYENNPDDYTPNRNYYTNIDNNDDDEDSNDNSIMNAYNSHNDI